MANTVTKRQVIEALQAAAQIGSIASASSYDDSCRLAYHYLLGYLGSMVGLDAVNGEVPEVPHA